MDFVGIITGSVAVISLFVGLPAVITAYLYKNAKNKREKEIERLKYQKEILALELEKQHTHLRLLEDENKKLDRILNDV
jgi:H+/gluconate symporter-like permease